MLALIHLFLIIVVPITVQLLPQFNATSLHLLVLSACPTYQYKMYNNSSFSKELKLFVLFQLHSQNKSLETDDKVLGRSFRTKLQGVTGDNYKIFVPFSYRQL